MVSRTLAEIYTNQRQYDEAARVYEQLALQEPENAREFMRKAAEMRRKAKKG
jgi:thioredoxin-like negative regulator of GroEL